VAFFEIPSNRTQRLQKAHYAQIVE
jgi:hypothetical protein